MDKALLSVPVQNAPFVVSALAQATKNLPPTSILAKSGSTMGSVATGAGIVTNIYATGSYGFKTYQDWSKGAYGAAGQDAVNAAGNAGSVTPYLFQGIGGTAAGAAILPPVIAAPGAMMILKGYERFYEDTTKHASVGKGMVDGYRLGLDMAGGAIGAIIGGTLTAPGIITAPIGAAGGFAAGVAITDSLLGMAISRFAGGI